MFEPCEQLVSTVFFNNVAQQFVVGTTGNTIYILLQLTRCIPLVKFDYNGITGEGKTVHWKTVHGKNLTKNELALEILQLSESSHQNDYDIEVGGFAAILIRCCTKQ